MTRKLDGKYFKILANKNKHCTPKLSRAKVYLEDF